MMKKIVGFSTKQRGYGRQSLYVDILIGGETVKDVYAQDIFPNVQEHFDFVLTQDAFELEGGKYTDGNGNGIYDRTFDTVLDAVQHFVDVDDFVLPEKFVIAWDVNTFKTKYYNDSEPNGVQIIDNATTYVSEEEAQAVIDENNWENCYVTTL